jgi:hypothetical protein
MHNQSTLFLLSLHTFFICQPKNKSSGIGYRVSGSLSGAGHRLRIYGSLNHYHTLSTITTTILLFFFPLPVSPVLAFCSLFLFCLSRGLAGFIGKWGFLNTGHGLVWSDLKDMGDTGDTVLFV